MLFILLYSNADWYANWLFLNLVLPKGQAISILRLLKDIFHMVIVDAVSLFLLK